MAPGSEGGSSDPDGARTVLFDLVMRIVIVSAMVLAALMFLAYWMRKRYKKAGNPA